MQTEKMKKVDMYRCGMDELWKRQIGETYPRTFAHRIGGCQDRIQRLELSVLLGKHKGCVNTVHFNPSGDLLVSGSDDREIIIWDWATGNKKLSFNSGHTNNVFQARIMPFTDDRSIVSCAADGQVCFSTFGAGAIVWVSIKHPSLALSSSEARYRATTSPT